MDRVGAAGEPRLHNACHEFATTLIEKSAPVTLIIEPWPPGRYSDPSFRAEANGAPEKGTAARRDRESR